MKKNKFDNDNSDLKFTRKNNLISEIVMVDAIGRSGKGMMAHILSSFERVEKQHNLDIFEWVGIMWNTGKISTDAATTLLRFEGDTRLFNAYQSRDINFRFYDDTGVFKNAETLKYFKRLFVKNGDDALKECIKEKPIMQTCIHDGMRNSELFFSAFPNRLKMIYILRDLVPLINEWYESGFGERIGKDLREFQLTIKWNNDVVPYTAQGWEEEYLSITSFDRIIALLANHFKLNIGSYSKLNTKIQEDILLVSFEELVTDPMVQCERIASFLGTKITPFTKKILKKENCPRIIDPNKRDQMVNNIRNNASKKYRNVFDKLLVEYEVFHQGKSMIE